MINRARAVGRAVATLAAGAACMGNGQAIAQSCETPPLVVRDTTVWTPAGPLAHRDVVFRDGRVAVVRQTSAAPVPGAASIDGAGHTLLPGLIDAHLHFVVPGGLPPGTRPGREMEVTGRQLLQSGVTAGRVHLASLDDGAATKRRSAEPCAPLPRVQTAGPGISGAAKADYPQFWGVQSPADAAAKIGRVADAGLDWVAIHDADAYAPEALDALVAAARTRQVRLMGSGGKPGEIEAVLRAAPATLDYFDRTSSAGYDDALLAAIRRRPGLVLAPTFGIHARVAHYAADPARLDDAAAYTFLEPAERAHVVAAARASLAKEAAGRAMPSLPRKAGQIFGAGLPLAIASDAGSPLHFQAGAIWWDLEAWRLYGASPRQVLTAATEGGARVLGLDDVGHLRPGARADFVLYRGDVEQGAFDAARVRAVGKDGVLFVRDGAWTGR
jgi:hypothetical protein